ncbi:uncharacterized protein SAMN04515674_10690 [Pseudarcicella hirudinis]|uniref:Radical SAM core domain-containing protein n=1 Tax=Pseudarcicella hirudinis TaxID=1079859 RepID=A0A1I5TKX9_9BACT|nr:radical SAM protein [Pseudarcicella hirudinis]SFP83531.1 uncharacterized protein SAMN04515674_10690 [Pseudarcicella hirudinis]
MNNYLSTLRATIVVVKIASRCNLNCSYCYMYNMGDQTYLSQPKVMSDKVVDKLIERILGHCKLHNIDNYEIVLHGGEPLLAGKEFFRKFVSKANKILVEQGGIRVRYVVQTNGLLLSDDWCKLFAELKIGVGVSLDGTPEDNDQYRIDHKGKGSYDRIVKGLNQALNSSYFKEKKLGVGVLAVINIDSEPEAVYEHFKSLSIKSTDVLLPLNNYDQPAPKPSVNNGLSEESPYGDWLVRLFNIWFYDKSPNRLRIRFFEGIIKNFLGKNVSSDDFGTKKCEALVIETDGSIEAVDALKVCGNGFTKAGATLFTHDFDEALQTPLANLYHLSHFKLPQKCMACPVREVCGGGYLPHRYGNNKGFNNPSIYCEDLLKIITHIQNHLFNNMSEEFLNQANVSQLDYLKIKRNFADFNEAESEETLELEHF